MNLTETQGNVVLDQLKLPRDFTFKIDEYYSMHELETLRARVSLSHLTHLVLS